MKYAKLSFFDPKTYKGDYKLHFQCNNKFGRWHYHQKIQN